MSKQLETLNKKQEKVNDALQAAFAELTIRELARKCFPGVRPVEKADSWVRNALRKLVAIRAAKKVNRGTYRGTT